MFASSFRRAVFYLGRTSLFAGSLLAYSISLLHLIALVADTTSKKKREGETGCVEVGVGAVPTNCAWKAQPPPFLKKNKIFSFTGKRMCGGRWWGCTHKLCVAGSQFTCLTSTKVQILTLKDAVRQTQPRHGLAGVPASLNLLALLVQKNRY